MAEIITKITLRQGTTSEWNNENSVKLEKGEMGLEYCEDGTVKIKAGDGVSHWSNLSYVGSDVKAANVFQVDLTENDTDDISAIEAKVNAENAKKQNGDVAIVKTTFGGGKVSYTSYVYDSELDTNSETSTKGWSAMDGNYSASNVFFKEDLMTTTAMGNITLTNGQATIPAKGQNIVDVFNTIYVKEDNIDLKKSSPSAKLSSTTTTYYEIGKTGSRNITVSLNDDGEYKYGYLPIASEKGTESAGDTASTITTGTGTGVVVTAENPYELTFNGSAVTPTSTNGATFTLSPAAQTAMAEMKMKGRVNYEKGGIPVSNLKKLYPAQRIAAGYDDTDEASAFKWYIPFYQGFTFSDTVIADPKNITATQLTTGLTAPVKQTSDGKVVSTSQNVKNVDSTAYNKTKCTKAAASKAWRQYFLAYPTDWGYDMSGAKDANGIDCTVNKANEVTVNLNGTDVKYTVYYINNAADYGTLGITWTLN
jgi:hypothetical protein